MKPAKKKNRIGKQQAAISLVTAIAIVLMSVFSASNLFIHEMKASAGSERFSLNTPDTSNMPYWEYTATDTGTSGTRDGTAKANEYAPQNSMLYTQGTTGTQFPSTGKTVPLSEATGKKLRHTTAMNGACYKGSATVNSVARTFLDFDNSEADSAGTGYQMTATGGRTNDTAYMKVFKWDGGSKASSSQGVCGVVWNDITLTEEEAAILKSVTVTIGFGAYNIDSGCGVRLNYFIQAYSEGAAGWLNGQKNQQFLGGLTKIAENNTFIPLIGNGSDQHKASGKAGDPISDRSVTLTTDFSKAKFIRVGFFAFGDGVNWWHTPVVQDFSVQYADFKLNTPSAAEMPTYMNGRNSQTTYNYNTQDPVSSASLYSPSNTFDDAEDYQGHVIENLVDATATTAGKDPATGIYTSNDRLSTLRHTDYMNGVSSIDGYLLPTGEATGQLDPDGSLRGRTTGGGAPFYAPIFKEDGGAALNAVVWSDIVLGDHLIDSEQSSIQSVRVQFNMGAFCLASTTVVRLNFFVIAYSAGTPGYINGRAAGEKSALIVAKNGDRALQENAYVALTNASDGVHSSGHSSQNGNANEMIDELTLSGDFSGVSFLRIGYYAVSNANVNWWHTPVVAEFEINPPTAGTTFQLKKPTNASQVTGYTASRETRSEDSTAKDGTDWDNYALNNDSDWTPQSYAKSYNKAGTTAYSDKDGTEHALQGFVHNGAQTVTATSLRSATGFNATYNPKRTSIANDDLYGMDEYGMCTKSGDSSAGYNTRMRNSGSNGGETGFQAIYWADIILTDDERTYLTEMSASMRMAATKVASDYAYLTYFLIGYSGGYPGYINGEGERVFEAYSYQRYGNTNSATGNEYATRGTEASPTRPWPAKGSVAYEGDFSEVTFVRIGLYLNKKSDGWVHSPVITDYAYTYIPDPQPEEELPAEYRTIRSKGDLKNLADALNGKFNDGKGYTTEGVTITLENDLELTSDVGGDYFNLQIARIDQDKMKLFGGNPSYPKAFQGEFDGKGHTIRGLTQGPVDGMTSIAAMTVTGLFGMVGESAHIHDFVLIGGDSGSSLTAPINVGSGHGSVAAWCYGEISDIVNLSCNIAVTDSAGGIVGYLGGSGTVRDCVNFASVRTTHNAQSKRVTPARFSMWAAGGIVGELDQTDGAEAGVKNVANYGSISMTGDLYSIYVGGIVGVASSNFRIENTYNFGAINTTDSSTTDSSTIGGILGTISGTSYTTGGISYSYSTEGTEDGSGGVYLICSYCGWADGAVAANCPKVLTDKEAAERLLITEYTGTPFAVTPEGESYRINGGLPYLTSLHALLVSEPGTDGFRLYEVSEKEEASAESRTSQFSGEDQTDKIKKSFYTDTDDLTITWADETAGALYLALDEALLPKNLPWLDNVTITESNDQKDAYDDDAQNPDGEFRYAGTYAVSVAVNFLGARVLEGSGTYEITKYSLGDVTLSIPGGELRDDVYYVTYNGADQPASLSSGNVDVLTGYRFVYIYTKEGASSSVPKHAGTYNVSAKLYHYTGDPEDARNGTSVDLTNERGLGWRNFTGSLPTDLILCIEAKTVTYSFEHTDGGDGGKYTPAYSGEGQSPGISTSDIFESDKGVSLGLAYADGREFNPIKDAMDAEIVLKGVLVGDAYNDYTIAESKTITFRILPLSLRVEFADKNNGVVTKTYNGEEQLPTLLFGGADATEYGWLVGGDIGLDPEIYFEEIGGGTQIRTNGYIHAESQMRQIRWKLGTADGFNQKNYQFEGDSDVSFRIVAMNVVVTPIENPRTYNATAQRPEKGKDYTIRGADGEELQAPFTDLDLVFSYENGPIEGRLINAGKYTLSKKLSYDVAGSIPKDFGYQSGDIIIVNTESDFVFEIARAQLSADDVSYGMTTFTYNGKQQTPTLTLTGGLVAGETKTFAEVLAALDLEKIYYKLNESGERTVTTELEVVNAGRYYVEYASTKGNYALPEGCGTEFTINKMSRDAYTVTIYELTKSNETSVFENKNEDGCFFGSATYKIGAETSTIEIWVIIEFAADDVDFSGKEFPAILSVMVNGSKPINVNCDAKEFHQASRIKAEPAYLEIVFTISGYQSGDVITISYAGVQNENLEEKSGADENDDQTVVVKERPDVNGGEVNATYGDTNVIQSIAGLTAEEWNATIKDTDVISACKLTPGTGSEAGKAELTIAGAGKTTITLTLAETETSFGGSTTIEVEIQKAGLTLEYEGQTIVYGDSLSAELNGEKGYRFSGFKYLDTEEKIFGTLTLKLVPSNGKAAITFAEALAKDFYLPVVRFEEKSGSGVYQMALCREDGELFTETELKNYKLDSTGQEPQIEVKPAEITVKPAYNGGNEIVYGTVFAAEALKLEINSGTLVGEDTIATLFATGVTYTLVDTENRRIEEGEIPPYLTGGAAYDITATGPAELDNYNVGYVTGELYVRQAALDTLFECANPADDRTYFYTGSPVSYFDGDREALAAALEFMVKDAEKYGDNRPEDLKAGWEISNVEYRRFGKADADGGHTDAGFYDIVITIAPFVGDNYSLGTFILKNAMTIEQVDLPIVLSVPESNPVYNAEALWSYVSGATAFGDLKLSFYLKTGDGFASEASWTSDSDATIPTPAGVYGVKVTFTPTGYVEGLDPTDEAYYASNYRYSDAFYQIDGRTYEFVVEKAHFEADVEGLTAEFTARSQTVSAKAIDVKGEEFDDAAVEIEYVYARKTGVPLSEGPVNVGEYDVTITIRPASGAAADDLVRNYAETTIKRSMTISKAALTIELKEESFTLNYKGVDQSVGVLEYVKLVGVNGDEPEATSGNVTVLFRKIGSGGLSAFVNSVGHYAVIVNYSDDVGNYMDASAEFGGETGVVEVTAAEVQIVLSTSPDRHYTYTGRAIPAVATARSGITNGERPAGMLVYQYSKDGAEWSGDTPINAGSYYIKIEYAPAPDDNFTLSEPFVTEEPTLIIDPATPSIRLVSQIASFGATDSLVVDPALLLEKGLLTISATVDFEVSAEEITINIIGMPEGEMPVAVGRYTIEVIWIAAEGRADRENFAPSARRVVSDAIVITSQIPRIELKDEAGNVLGSTEPDTASGAASFVYDGTGRGVGSGLSVFIGSGEESEPWTRISYKGTGIKNWADGMPTHVGTYSVRVYYAADKNYQSRTVIFDNVLVITPKSATATFTAAQAARLNKVYDGAGIPGIIDFTIEGLVAGDLYTGELQAAEGVNAGLYTVTLGTLSLGSDYTLAMGKDEGGETFRFEIRKRTLGLEFDEINLIYDGASKSVGVRLRGVLEGDIAPSPTIEYEGDRVNVGNFTVRVTVQDRNYALEGGMISNTYTIAPATLPRISFESVRIAYDGKPHTISVDPATLPENAIVTYIGATTFFDIGSYVIHASVKKQNYETVTLEATLTIERGVLDPMISIPSRTYYYGDAMPELLYDTELGYAAFDAGQEMDPAVRDYTYTFVPYDDHYETIYGTIQISVRRASVQLGVKGDLAQAADNTYALAPVLPEGVQGTVRVEYLLSDGTWSSDVPVAPGRYAVRVTFETSDARYASTEFITELVIEEQSHFLLYFGIGIGVFLALAIASGVYFSYRRRLR